MHPVKNGTCPKTIETACTATTVTIDKLDLGQCTNTLRIGDSLISGTRARFLLPETTDDNRMVYKAYQKNHRPKIELKLLAGSNTNYYGFDMTFKCLDGNVNSIQLSGSE